MSRISPKAKKQIRAKQEAEAQGRRDELELAHQVRTRILNAGMLDAFLADFRSLPYRRAVLEHIRRYITFRPQPRRRTWHQLWSSLLCRHEDVAVTGRWNRCNKCGRWNRWLFLRWL